jgi:2-polyprenyl-3-methyl-5-hydroxy-6-metoxy-1,4-benzoquinol methylase
VSYREGINPVETKESVFATKTDAQAFDSRYQNKESFRRRQRLWTKTIVKYIHQGDICLDAGCGTGIMTNILLSNDAVVTAFDQSEAMLTVARSKFGPETKNITLLQGELPLDQQSEILNATYDLIICSSVLEYVQDFNATISQFHKILRPGGILIISLPNEQSFLRQLERLVQFVRRETKSYLSTQYHQFSREDAIAQLKAVHFDVLEDRYFGLPSLLYRFGLPENCPIFGTMFICVLKAIKV